MKIKVVLLYLIVIFSFDSCKFLQDRLSQYAPEIKLKEVKLKSFDLEAADLEYTFSLRNKVDFSITFTKLKFQIAVDGKRMVDMQNDKNVQVKAREETTFTIVQRVRYVETIESIFEFYKKEQVNIALEGLVGVLLSEALGAVEVPISAEKMVPVPKLPSVQFGSLDFVNMNLSNPLNPSANFELKFSVRNRNPFDIDLPRIEYAFTAAGTNVVSGLKQNQRLKQNEVSMLSIPVTLRGREIIDLVPKLRDLSTTSYKFNSVVEIAVFNQIAQLPFYFP